MTFTLRVVGTGDHLLRAEDGALAVVGQDSNTGLQHPHGGEGVAAATGGCKHRRATSFQTVCFLFVGSAV